MRSAVSLWRTRFEYALLRLRVSFRGWRFLARLAVFWLAEVVLQGAWLFSAGEGAGLLSLLYVPTALSVFFALSAVAAFTRNRLRARSVSATVPAPLTPRAEGARIRAELAVLGRRRLDGLIGEDEFLAQRDDVLRPITRLART